MWFSVTPFTMLPITPPQDRRSSRPTRRLAVLAGAALLALHAGSAWALYKVVGPDGKITYTDRPPVDKPVQTLSANGAVASTDALPFELRAIASRFPVTLYTTRDCGPCDSGRNALRQRGVPFTEKTVNTGADTQALQRLEGTNQLPVLRVGQQQVMGYADAEWQSYLDAAGYPKQSLLPRTYAWPDAAPLAPQAAAPARTTSGSAAGAQAPSNGSTSGGTAAPGQSPVAPPPGIRF